MPPGNFQQLANFIWPVVDLLRGFIDAAGKATSQD